MLMFWSPKMLIYTIIISVLSFFGAMFVGVYVIIEKVVFPVYISMKMHKLKNDGDVLSAVEKKQQAVLFFGMRITEEIDVLENAYFVDLGTLRKTYLKFTLYKIIIILLFIIFGIHTIIGFFDVMNVSQFEYIACGLGMIFLITKLFVNFNLLNKIWYKKFVIKTVDIKGIDYYGGYISRKNKEPLSLLKKIMK